MEVGGSRVEALVNAEGPALGQAFAELLLHRALKVRVAVLDAAHQELHLGFDGSGRCRHPRIRGWVLLSAARIPRALATSFAIFAVKASMVVKASSGLIRSTSSIFRFSP